MAAKRVRKIVGLLAAVSLVAVSACGPEEGRTGSGGSGGTEIGESCEEGLCPDEAIIEGVLQAVNEARSSETDCGQYGVLPAVGPVTGDALLHQASHAHTIDMRDNDFFSHTGSDGSSFSQRINDTGYSGSPVGENIAGGGTEPAGVVARWIDSDGHCRNIMNGSANQIGVGYVSGGQWGSLWTLKLASGS